MYEKDRIRGVRVGDINILYRAENRIKRYVNAIEKAYGGAGQRLCYLHD